MEEVTKQDLAMMHKRVVNANWYVFGAVMLTVGMFAITGVTAWFIVSIPAIWLFGVVSALVICTNMVGWSKSNGE